VDGHLTQDRKGVKLTMEAGNNIFGKQAAGAPFKVYAPGKYLTPESEGSNKPNFEAARDWDYAVSAGDELTDSYPIEASI
jgi:phospholipase C